jgi:hypothetical protein
MVLFRPLKTCQLFEIYFWDFPVLGIRQRCPWMMVYIPPFAKGAKDGAPVWFWLFEGEQGQQQIPTG